MELKKIGAGSIRISIDRAMGAGLPICVPTGLDRFTRTQKQLARHEQDRQEATQISAETQKASVRALISYLTQDNEGSNTVEILKVGDILEASDSDYNTILQSCTNYTGRSVALEVEWKNSALDLSVEPGRADILIELVKKFSSDKSLKKLDLTGNLDIGLLQTGPLGTVVCELTILLPLLTSCEILILDHIYLDRPHCMDAISDYLNLPGIPLKILSLNYCKLKDDFTMKLPVSSKLETLSLVGNNGIILQPSFTSSLTANTSLKNLDLSGCNIAFPSESYPRLNVNIYGPLLLLNPTYANIEYSGGPYVRRSATAVP